MRCGICGEHYGDLLLKHGERCEDDRKAGAMPYAFERAINDLIREQEEEKKNG